MPITNSSLTTSAAGDRKSRWSSSFVQSWVSDLRLILLCIVILAVIEV